MTTEEEPTKNPQPDLSTQPGDSTSPGSGENESSSAGNDKPVEVAVISTPAPPAAESKPLAEQAAVAALPEIPIPPTTDATSDSPSGSSQVTQESSASANESAVAELSAATPQSSGDRPSDRMRQKMGVAGTVEKPVGSVDLETQRPEIPTDVEPVDIPEKDVLADDIEAQISAAMDGDVPVPVTTVPVPAEFLSEAADADAPVEVEEIGPGSRVKGTVQHIHGDDVFLNAGLIADVIISLKQFAENKQPSVGDSLEAIVDNIDGDGLFRARLPEAKTKAGGNWEGLAVGQVIDCTVTGTNKGGLQVTVGGLKGFLPASQVDLGYVSELEKYVGQKIAVQVTEVKPKKRNLVVSRRAILQAERENAQVGFWETLEVGQDFPGTVKTLKNYGAFVNLGPIDGFLHVGEISWSRINHPNEVLKEGQEVQVRILKIDREKSRISLGMKQLMQNPWLGLSERYPKEHIVSGKVTRVSDFGAFVELEPGVEGLVHISQLAWRRVGTVAEMLKPGDEKDFQVLEVDQKRKRVSLSLKALEQKPESVRKAEAEEGARPVRKPNLDLRGGTGKTGGGGLFGNPTDFNS